MVIRSTTDQRVSFLRQTLGKVLTVGDHSLLILHEIRFFGLFQSGGQSTDSVIVRAALVTREHRRVDTILQIVHDLCV